MTIIIERPTISDTEKIMQIHSNVPQVNSTANSALAAIGAATTTLGAQISAVNSTANAATAGVAAVTSQVLEHTGNAWVAVSA